MIFAQVTNGTVTNIIVAEQDFIDTLPAEENVEWIKDTAGNKAKIGGIYEKTRGVFCDAKPGIDWTLDDDNYWKPPIPFPVAYDDNVDLVGYYWDENLYKQDNTKGWVFTIAEPLETIYI